jgi:hypothetical protein
MMPPVNWVSGTLLGLGLLPLVATAASGRRSDAAGRGMANAFAVIGFALWLLFAGLFALGVWLDVWFLRALPIFLGALPFPFLAIAGVGELRRRAAARRSKG